MASVSNNYEINVAKGREHYCRIQLSESYEEEAKEKLKELREIFGDEYRLTMTYWLCKGIRVDVDND